MTDNTPATFADDDLDAGTLEVFPPKRATSSSAVAMLDQHVQAMQFAYELASKMVETEMVPTRFRRKADDATAAILYGAELGLNPIQSLQNVFPVNGSPGIYARTMQALLKARGYQFKTIEKAREAVEIHGWEPGRDKDSDEPDETSRWTIEDADLAGYTKNAKYQTDPKAMLYAKALAEVCRHLAPDVLLGIAYSVEDLELDSNEPTPRSAKQRPSGGSGVAGMRAAREQRQQREEPVDAEEVSAPEPEPSPQPGESEIRKTARKKLTDGIFAEFGKVGLNGDDNRADRMTVIRALVDAPGLTSSKGLTDDQLQLLRNELVKRREAKTLEDDIREFVNADTLRQDGEGGEK